MAKIFLPTMAAFNADVETMYSLLKRTVGGSGHEIGLEIIGLAKHFFGEESDEWLGKIVANINALGAINLTVHGFSGLDVYTSGAADMRTKKNLLKKYLYLAEAAGANYVHVHSGVGYKGKIQSNDSFLGQIRNNLLSVTSGQTIKVGIENLPSPSTGDLETDPKKIWRDYVESLEDCLTIVRGTDLKVTLDTCHYACGLSDNQIDLVAAAEQLGDYLYYLHVSDVSDRWIPYQSVWKEGVIPGDGRIGKKEFARFFRYIQKKYPDIGICIEVANTNFKNPKESAEAIKRVLDWLA